MKEKIKHRPIPPVSPWLAGYHVHIYYTLRTRAQASALRERMRVELALDYIFFGSLLDRPHGPHPIPTFEADISPRDLMPTLRWLIKNRGELSVLVHEDTGDDPVDHASGALWLGTEIKLELSKLDPSPVGRPPPG